MHKEHIAVAYVSDEPRAETTYVGPNGPRSADIDKLIRRLRSKASQIIFTYEAGPCGYNLYRHLRKKCYPCLVSAPSLIPKKPGLRVKTDCKDAVQLARLLPLSQALQALRGVQFTVAVTTLAEAGDIARFDNPRHAFHQRPAWGTAPVWRNPRA